MIAIKKWMKIALVVIEVLIMALLITFAAVSTKRGKIIKAKDIRIENLMKQREDLLDNIEKLGAEDVLTVNISFNLKQTNVLSVSNNNCQQIAKEVATLTRQELYDSLYNRKKDVEFTLDTTYTDNGGKILSGNIKKK